MIIKVSAPYFMPRVHTHSDVVDILQRVIAARGRRRRVRTHNT
jgi:hypothetical protein